MRWVKALNFGLEELKELMSKNLGKSNQTFLPKNKLIFHQTTIRILSVLVEFSWTDQK